MTDEYRRPSSAEIDVATLRAKHGALSEDVHEIKELVKQIHSKQSEIAGDLRLGAHRFNAVETRLDTLESDKKGPIAMILAVLSSIGTGATAWFK